MRIAATLLMGLWLWGCNCGGRVRPSSQAFVLEPTEVNFGQVPAREIVERAVQVRNTGTAPLVLARVSVEGAPDSPFSLGRIPEEPLASGESVELRVFFTAPATPGARHEAVLEVETDATADTLVAYLFGEVTLETKPDAGQPDGGHPTHTHWIAFDSNREAGNRDVYVMRPDGSDLRRLTQSPFTEAYPAFSPDGKYLAFASDSVDFTMQLFVMDLETRATRQVTTGTKPALMPAWSPDGKRLAFKREISIHTVALDGTDERVVITGLNELNAYQHPVYLPGSNWLVADRGNQIDMVRTDGTDLRQIVQNDTLFIRQPTVAPGGAQIAFAASCAGFSVRAASTAGNTSACNGASQVHFPGRRPAWGPELIAFESDEENSDIWVVSPIGQGPRNLTNHPADDRNPAWSGPTSALK